MNRFFLSLLFSLLCNVSFCQERDYVKEMENNDLKIRQKPNTERLLTNFLDNININEDTIYAVLYVPAACPRCEAAIPNFYRLLKANSQKNKMLLITVYEDTIASYSYIKKQNYVSDYYLYDTDNYYKSIFSFNTEGIVGLYILKICPKQGVMLTGGQYTFLGKKFIKQLR